MGETSESSVGTATATVKVGDAVVGTATFQIVAPPPAPVIPVTPSAPAQLPFNPDAGKTTFTDVAGNAWYASAVNCVVDKGLMNGTGEGEFSPEAATTRGMIVTICSRVIAPVIFVPSEISYSIAQRCPA